MAPFDVFKAMSSAVLAKMAPSNVSRVDAMLNATADESFRFQRRRDELAGELDIPLWFANDYTTVVGVGSQVYMDVHFRKPMATRRFVDPDVAIRLLAERIQLVTPHVGGPRNDEDFNRFCQELSAWSARVEAASTPL